MESSNTEFNLEELEGASENISDCPVEPDGIGNTENNVKDNQEVDTNDSKLGDEQTINCSFCKETVLKSDIFMHTRMHIVTYGDTNLDGGVKGEDDSNESDSDDEEQQQNWKEESKKENEEIESNSRKPIRIKIKVGRIKTEDEFVKNNRPKTSSNLNLDFRNLTRNQMEGLFLLKCSFCKENVPKMFIKEHTEKHVKSPMKNHFCQHCGKSFTDKWKLNQHITIHTGEKPHQCPICEQSFRLKMSLKRHTEIVHTRLCLYSCDQCGESFNTKRGLQTHLETKHGIEVGFKCDQCNNRYLTEKGLEEHKQSDNCFKHCCHHCGKMFKIKSKLEAHAQSHLEEKIYKASCHLCGKGFTAKTSLQEHERMHLNLKQFVCECGKAFNRKNGLIAHKKTHLNHF